jgi:hypothetical protein
MNLFEYLEFINTECTLISSPSPILAKKAIKLDGNPPNGLKHRIGLGTLKSCDYIKFNKNEILFIEFSDLCEQLRNLNSSLSTVSGIVPCRLVTTPVDIIKTELQQKISETKHIFNSLSKTLGLSNNKQEIFIIVMCKQINTDIIFFDKIVRDLRRKFSSLFQIELYSLNTLPSSLV